MSARSDVVAIEAALRELGRPERAAGEKRYLKSDLDFLGVDVPTLRRTTKGWLRERPEINRRRLVALARALWRTRVHELRTLGVEIIDQRSDLLESADLAVVEWMLRRANTWAHVDALAVQVAGGLVQRFPALASTLDRWAKDESFWLRRSAMLALLVPLRRGEGDWRRFTRYADAMLEETEFFIRKAIGWVLREASKSDPDRVRGFVAARLDRISGLTLREAIKRLPEADREPLLSAYRAR